MIKFRDYFCNFHTRYPLNGKAGDWIAAGCSHTAGYGVEPEETYVALLAQQYDRPIHNLALGNANHGICRRNIQLWFATVGVPELVLVQWPHHVRRTSWRNNFGELVGVSQSDKILHTMLHEGEQNLLADWLDSIIALNQFCRAYNTPVVNIVLDTVSDQCREILDHFDITVHDDKKLPGASWIFDNSGTDNLHHSARCHQLWSQRLHGIINENTAH